MTDNDTDTLADDDAKLEAEFGSGFAGVAEVTTDRSERRGQKKPLIDLTKSANGKAEPAQDASREKAEPAPEYIQITKSDWEDVRAERAKYEQQFSKAFGTIGNLQKQLNGFKAAEPPPAAPPVKPRVEISREAFAEMEKDFPELAQQTRAALEAALSGLPAPAGSEIDAAKIEGLFASYASRLEIKALEDAYPEWREIVGAVAAGESPDPDQPFRKWLAGKGETYQKRINNSERAEVIENAIALFQKETAAPKTNGTARATAAATAAADRFKAAVQPRGDSGGPPPGKSEDEEFESGFNSR